MLAAAAVQVEMPSNGHVVIPLLVVVFGLPVAIITLLCVIQRRNKRLQKLESERIKNRRLSA